MRLHCALPAALALATSAACAAAAGAARPNFLIVINDDQSWLECSAYGGSSIQTPNFDRVARDGILFTHGYTSAPSCAPSRAALLTGRNFWELEQGAFIQAWLPAKFPLLPNLLEAAGYHAGYTGKGWGPGVPEPGVPARKPAGKDYNTIKRKHVEEGISNIDYAANFSAFLDERPEGRPFYFWLGPTEPHHPHGRENHKKLGADLAAIKVPAFLPDTPGVRMHRANYLYEVRHADATLGAALAVLEKRGELPNTLVIVTADNGTPVPRAKANVYDWGVRVPLAMMWPAAIAPGRRVEDFVNFIDLAPTLLEASGAAVPADMSGRSLLPILRSPASGQIDPSRTWTTAGLEWHGTELAARMIRDQRYQYIVNYTQGSRRPPGQAPRKPAGDFETMAATGDVMPLIEAFPDHPAVAPFRALIDEPRPREELYDCLADPCELTNLAATAEAAPVKERLRAQLEQYQRQTGDPRATGEMSVFQKTLGFVQDRKRKGYKETGN